MKCLICENPRARLICTGVWTEFRCPECGTGRISKDLLSLMLLQQARFDVIMSRKWILERRQLDPLPTMQMSDFSSVMALH